MSVELLLTWAWRKQVSCHFYSLCLAFPGKTVGFWPKDLCKRPLLWPLEKGKDRGKMGGKLTISGRKVPNFGTFRPEIATFSLFFLIFPRFPSKTTFSRGNRRFPGTTGWKTLNCLKNGVFGAICPISGRNCPKSSVFGAGYLTLPPPPHIQIPRRNKPTSTYKSCL